MHHYSSNILDGLTFGNAMGLFHPDTAGHPRCLDEDVLMAFAPVVARDGCTEVARGTILLFPGGGGGRAENHPSKRD